MSYIRSAIFSLVYFCATVSYGTLSLFLFAVPSKVRHRIIISWTALIVLAVKVLCGIRYNVKGMEHLNTVKEPMVVLSKHQSTWETLYLQNLCFPASTVLKKELLKIPFFGWGLKGLMPIAIDRSNPREALKQVKIQGVDRLKKGYNIILFPEGTRVKVGEKNKYARSGADVAIAADAPILPIAVNAGYFWPGGSLVKHPGEISVVIGEPIYPKGKSSREIMDQVENWIESTMLTLKKER